MIIEKELHKISEDIESAMKNLNKNMHQPTKMDKIVQIDPVYGEAVQENDESEEHVGEVFAEKSKEAEGITPKTPSTGKKIKTAYTEQMSLDESLFEDYGNTVDEIRQFLRETVDWLISSEEGCGTLRLNYRLAVCVGWQEGYDPEDESVIHSTTSPEFGIVAGIKVWTSDDMLTDYEWINAPYYENGEVVDISASISPNEDYNWLARYFTEEYEKMKDWDIDEDGLILSEEPEDEEEEVEEKLDEMTRTELDKAKQEFRDEQKKLGVGWFGPERMKYVPLPDDMKKREREFACIEMINSILAYSPKRSVYTAEEILEDDLNSHPSYLKDDVDVLGKERVVELIQGQMDDIEGVDTDVYTDGEGVSYNSIRWKRESCERKGLNEDKIEGLPNNLYQLVYDRLFPDSVKNYKALILSDNPKYYTSDRYFTIGLPSLYDIGVVVKDEEDADLVKQLADFLKLPYEYKPYKGAEDFKGIAVIHMDEETGRIPTKEYLDKIGYEGEVRRDPNARKKVEVDVEEDEEETESVKSSDNKVALDEGVTIVTTSTLDQYEPWSGAKPWWEIIVKQGKVDELDAFLEEMYPDGIDETELNDLIWFEPEYVFEMLGINYDFQNDELITDEEEEEVEVKED